MLERLRAEWVNGANRFERRGGPLADGLHPHRCRNVFQAPQCAGASCRLGFYEHLGFERIDGSDTVSHRLVL